MQLIDAKTLALETMRLHNLSGKTGWSFHFDESTHRFGSCNITKKVITLSSRLTSNNGIEEVKDTILHEVAHALDYIETKHWGHGPTWKRICVRIGAKPKACFSFNDVNPATGRFRIVNKETGRVYADNLNVMPKFTKGIWNAGWPGCPDSVGKLRIEVIKN